MHGSCYVAGIVAIGLLVFLGTQLSPPPDISGSRLHSAVDFEQRPTVPPPAPAVQPTIVHVPVQKRALAHQKILPESCRTNPALADTVRQYSRATYNSSLVWSFAKFHKQPRGKTSASGGLGDRLRGVMYTLFVAISTERAFGIDFGDDPIVDHLLPSDHFPVPWQQVGAEAAARRKVGAGYHYENWKHETRPAQLVDVVSAWPAHVQWTTCKMDWHAWLRRFPKWAARLDRLGFHAQCGETCWFGCFWDLIFTASSRLQAAVVEHVGAHAPFVTYQARLGGLWSDVKVMDGRAVGFLQSMVQILLANTTLCGRPCNLFVTSDNEGPKAEMRRLYGGRAFTTGGKSYHVEKSKGNASAAYWKTLLDLYIAGHSKAAVVSRSSFITMAMWRTRVPFILVEALRAGPKMTFITGDIKAFVHVWGPATAGAKCARERGWFKPRGSVAMVEAQSSVAALLHHM
eukprot:GGOE01041707.1.p1 GENE.GGOE01041707.1~~GGOE01041707.1.p1  ORF type:complete len:459 (-),score=82.49 GGOE01041707.1:94-1470(-)